MGNRHISLSREDMAFIASPKPFMAAVSPLFFTHYGKTGEWAFNKNWIYRSDDLLYPSRWSSILSLTKERAPEIVQVISWNDYGESHNIAPVLGAEPGSAAWTRNMDHVAFREMTGYFARRWRDGAPEVEDEIVVWMWYRTHPKSMHAGNYTVGRPDHANWALDLINALVLVPEGLKDVELVVSNPQGRSGRHSKGLSAGRSNAVQFPFQAGNVEFELKSSMGTHMRHMAHPIYGSVEHYNFNMWSGAWRAKVPRKE
jgi:glucan endo-1,3-alpha-glucosidase